jgi:hypothetical protein
MNDAGCPPIPNSIAGTQPPINSAHSQGRRPARNATANALIDNAPAVTPLSSQAGREST